MDMNNNNIVVDVIKWHFATHHIDIDEGKGDSVIIVPRSSSGHNIYVTINEAELDYVKAFEVEGLCNVRATAQNPHFGIKASFSEFWIYPEYYTDGDLMELPWSPFGEDEELGYFDVMKHIVAST